MAMDLDDAKSQLHLLKLYQQEIGKALRSHHLAVFETYLPEEDVLKIGQTFVGGDEGKAQSLFVHSLLHCDFNRALFTLVLSAVRDEADGALHSRLLCTAAHDWVRFKLVLQHLCTTRWLRLLPAVQLANSLQATDPDNYGALTISAETCDDALLKSRRLVRELPYCSVNWYWHLHDAVDRLPPSAVSNALLPVFDHIQPFFRRHFDAHMATCSLQKPECFFIDANSQIDLNGAVAFDPSIGFPSPPPVDPDEFDEQCERGRLRLRAYQEELATAGLQRKNTIICAPTGSGKTIVAVKVILEHLIAGSRAGLVRRVAFVVPTVPLVGQQAAVVSAFVREPPWRVRRLAGGEFVPKQGVVRTSHVVVVTPQLLLNLFKSKDESERVALTDFSLLVLDECHHTAEKHPYNGIMQLYDEARFTWTAEERARLPQVVGLTASLGVGEATTCLEAVDHVARMCANLCATSISGVVQNLAELRRFIEAPTDEIVTVSSTFTQQPFFLKLNDFMAHVEEKYMLPTLISLRKGGELQAEHVKVPSPRFMQAYEAWYSVLLNKIPIAQKLEPNRRRVILTCIEYLRICFKALEINAHFPVEQSLDYLNRQMKDFGQSSAQPTDEAVLYNKFKDVCAGLSAERSAPNELTDRLVDLLTASYESNADARTIIFVRTREFTTCLQKHLEAHPVLGGYKVGRLTSINTTKEDGGQAENEQKQELSRFQAGETKMLVSTTVAEEGLDIEKCNLVVKFNHATNEIALVQRRGRGRAAGSRSVLLAIDKWIAEKEHVNKIREQLMTVALKYIRRQGEVWLQNKVDKVTAELREGRVVKRLLTDQREVALAKKSYRLLCRKCDALICGSESVRRLLDAHYVAADAAIFTRATVRPLASPALFAMMAQVGRVVCARCDQPWGVLIKYNKVFLPSIAAKAFKLQEASDGGQMHVSRQWEGVLRRWFRPQPFETRDLGAMHKALRNAFFFEAVVTDLERQNGRCLQTPPLSPPKQQSASNCIDDDSMEYDTAEED